MSSKVSISQRESLCNHLFLNPIVTDVIPIAITLLGIIVAVLA
jgi:hypothetical protein